MKAFIVFASTLLLMACSSVGQKVASGINNSHLKGTVGKPYTQVVYEHPDFGKLIGREKLNSGDEVMKHVGDFGTESSNFGGIYGKQNQNARVIYFLVNADGNIEDGPRNSIRPAPPSAGLEFVAVARANKCLSKNSTRS